jgi:hypothetical protein
VIAAGRVLYNRMVIGPATKMRETIRHFDENSANPQVEASLAATEFENLQEAEGCCGGAAAVRRGLATLQSRTSTTLDRVAM